MSDPLLPKNPDLSLKHKIIVWDITLNLLIFGGLKAIDYLFMPNGFEDRIGNVHFLGIWVIAGLIKSFIVLVSFTFFSIKREWDIAITLFFILILSIALNTWSFRAMGLFAFGW